MFVINAVPLNSARYAMLSNLFMIGSTATAIADSASFKALYQERLSLTQTTEQFKALDV